jgi:hypothetical protein
MKVSAPASIVAPALRDNATAYTDAPLPHPNLLLGSLQLSAWLYFRPTAWRNHLAHIDPTLQPIFCLAELRRAQWRNPALQRFLLQIHLLAMLVFGSISFLMLMLQKDPPTFLTAVITGYLICGLTIGPVYYTAPLIAFAVAFLIASYRGIDGWLYTPLIYGIMASVFGDMVGPEHSFSFGRRLGGLVIGLLVGGLLSAVFLKIAFIVNGVLPYHIENIGFGAAISPVLIVAISWRTRSWYRGIWFGSIITIGMLILMSWLVYQPNVVLMDFMLHFLPAYTQTVFFSLIFAFGLRYIAPISGAWSGIIAAMIAIALADSASYAPFFNNQLDWTTGVRYLWLFPIGLTITWWRPIVLYPFQAAWNTMLYHTDLRRPADRPSLLHWHAACWDEGQRLPLAGLDDHLLLVLERNPSEGLAAMEYLARGHQRWAAQAAQIELDARLLERCPTVAAISTVAAQLVVGDLTGPANALLRSFSRISQDVAAALRLVNPYHQRLALRAIEDQLDGLLRELTRSSEPYALRFRPIVTHWHRLVADQHQLLSLTAEQRQEIDNPYVVGVPLSAQQAIFVGRTDISRQIESLLLDRQCPPLLLYGQRRIGKTSLLNNLGRLLPHDIVPLFIDLQGPVALASSHAGLLAALVRAMQLAAQHERALTLPPLPAAELATDPFPRFDAWLDAAELVLAQRTALLMLDEFEVLESFLAAGSFDERAVLGMLRHIIQHRPRWKILLAGSHTLDEVQRWASYLINVQVIPISYLSVAETRQLVEQPSQEFALRYTPEASAAVFALTRGHPALVQLLCTAIIEGKNRQPPEQRRRVGRADVDAVIPEALQRGSFFFADIERNQTDAAGQALLRALAQQGAGAMLPMAAIGQLLPEGAAPVVANLLRRELIEAVDGGYRFNVELIRRWFLQLAP